MIGERGEQGYINGLTAQRFFQYDLVSIWKIDAWLIELQVEGSVKYYQRKNGIEYSIGLLPLDNDAAVVEMASNGLQQGEVDVYVKHLQFEELYALLVPMQPRRVVIEELLEDDSTPL